VYLALAQVLPQEVDSRLTNMAFLMMGIFGARSVLTGRLAAHSPVQVKKPSLVRRMEGDLDNGGVRVRTGYAPIARGLVQAAGVTGESALAGDRTKGSAHHRRGLVGLAYRPRVIPFAGTWVRTRRGQGSPYRQRAVLSYVRSLLPADAQVSLVGDGEFGHMPLGMTLQAWPGDDVLRQSGHQLVDVASEPDWRRLDALICRGAWPFLNDGHLTAMHQGPTHGLLAWDRHSPTPWLLATNLTKPRHILRLDHRRLWIEATDGDLKDTGLDLARSGLCHFLRLSRLTLAVALL
jgi:hypothetical protein